MGSTICHFEIPVDDLQTAQKFYAELFGWTIAQASERSPEYLFIRTTERPDALGGALLKRTGEQQGVTLHVLVEDLQASLAQAQRLGAQVCVPKTALPGLGWTALIRDPTGHVLGLFQHDEEAAKQ